MNARNALLLVGFICVYFGAGVLYSHDWWGALLVGFGAMTLARD